MLFLRCAAVARLLSYKTGPYPFQILQRLCVDPVDAQDQIAFLAGDGAGFHDKISIVASRAMAFVAVHGACPAQLCSLIAATIARPWLEITIIIPQPITVIKPIRQAY